jgi:siroheme synthase-like protein
MGFYPVLVELAGRQCLVVGGGSVAEAKAEGLLDAGARITVISPSLTPRLAASAAAGRIHHERRDYRGGDLEGMALAITATDSSETNAAVAREGQRRGVWVNAADDPAHCDFILPAILRRGRLVVAVSTGGASPALAAAVRDELAIHLGDEYAALAEVASDVRRALRSERRGVNARAWREALSDTELRRLVARGDRAAARRHLRARLSGHRGDETSPRLPPTLRPASESPASASARPRGDETSRRLPPTLRPASESPASATGVA